MISNDHIINEYKQGKTINCISLENKIAACKIKKILNNNNIHIRSQEEQFFCDCLSIGIDIKNTITKYSNGFNIKQLADLYNTSETRIRKILTFKKINDLKQEFSKQTGYDHKLLIFKDYDINTVKII